MKTKVTVQIPSNHRQTTVESTVAKIRNQKLQQVEDAKLTPLEVLKKPITPIIQEQHIEEAARWGGLVVVVVLRTGTIIIYEVVRFVLKFSWKLLGVVFELLIMLIYDRIVGTPEGSNSTPRERTTGDYYNIKDARHSNITINNFYK